jgi:cytochrome d ubiquinol oxidase subunit I
MVGLGLAVIAIGLWGAWLWWRGGLTTNRAFLTLTTLTGPAGFVAVIAGWTTAEVGRQPWVVYGVMRTSESVSPVAAGTVSTSLLMFLIVYAIVFAAGLVYILRLIAEGPIAALRQPEPTGRRAPGSPLAAAPDEEAL